MKHTFTLLTALLLAPLTALQAFELSDLRCEYLENPLGIDVAKPRLGWKMEEPQSKISNLKSQIKRSVAQTAYQVLVASTPELLTQEKGDLWDSGKVEEDQSIQVEYKGKPLDSRMRCFWKVRVWDKDGKPSAWSAPSEWTMGLLNPADWSAKWIAQGSDLDGAQWIWFNEGNPAGGTPAGTRQFRRSITLLVSAEESMDKMWGDRTAKEGVEGSKRAELFREGNYGMFIHWGLYSHLGGQWKDKTFYGIGEWIKNQMQIPNDQYMAIAKEFNPSEFDANEIVRVATEAGMKWVIITSKHHEGFAMFESKHPFNIVDATPFKRDPMKELADACRAAGLGFGFYYSHFQDWTAPGGASGPGTNPDGSPASFDQYFKEKCFPQVDEICSNYGELSFVWFDTPGGMPVEHVKSLAELVRQKQPNAMLCSRIGHGMGDYISLGDMEVPVRSHEGLWETCDTTNDSWSYAWYDQNWKEPKEILHRLVSTVGRGGTYLLNVGPDGKGRIPTKATQYLLEAGKWVKQNPSVVYGASPSPWNHAQPWGDVTRTGTTLNLVVFDWPADRKICLPGIDGDIASATLRLHDGSTKPLPVAKSGTWSIVDAAAADTATVSSLAGVIELKFNAQPKIDQTLGIHPNIASKFSCEFANATNAERKRIDWMEKFGEWKFSLQVGNWQPGGVAEWEVDVAEAGDYHVALTYKGEGRPIWSVSTSEGLKIQNQQAASHVYKPYRTGIISFSKPGKHKASVSLVEGDPVKSSLEAITFIPVR